MNYEDALREIQQLLEANAKGNRPLKGEYHAQTQLMLLAQEAWPNLTDTTKGQLRASLLPVFDRCTASGDPEYLFDRIIALAPHKLLDALRYQEADIAKFKVYKGEDMYPMDQHTWLGRFMLWSRHGNSPLGYHWWSAISGLGAVCQRRVYWPAGKQIWPNMYIILGGDRSTGKGQGFSNIMEILQLVNDLLQEEAGLVAKPDPHKLIRIIPPDSTQEAIISSLAGNMGRGTITSPGDTEDSGIIQAIQGKPVPATGILGLDEMATWFGKGAWGADKRGSFLTTIKECDVYGKDTKISGEEQLRQLAFSLLACCAPDWMGSAIDSSMLGGGFKDRCIWVHRHPAWERREEVSILNAPPTDPLEARELARWLKTTILDHRLPVSAVKVDDDANKFLQRYYLAKLKQEKVAYGIFGSSGDYTSSNRLAWALAQIATLLAVSKGDLDNLYVGMEIAELTIELLDIEDQSMREFMEAAAMDKDIKWDQGFLAYITECHGCIKASLLHRKFRHFGPPTMCRKVISNLVDQGLIEVVRGHGNSANTTYYRLITHQCPKCEG